MNKNTEKLKSYTFNYGNAFKNKQNLMVIVLTKQKHEEDFFDSLWFDPLDYDSKEECFNGICAEYEIKSINDVDFELDNTELVDPLRDLFFDKNNKPKDAIFDFGKLDPHVQDVVNCYASAFDIDKNTTLLELLETIEKVYLGKHDSPDGYAELEVDNQAFGIEVPELLKDHIDFETLGEEMVKNIIIVDDHYFSKK